MAQTERSYGQRWRYRSGNESFCEGPSRQTLAESKRFLWKMWLGRVETSVQSQPCPPRAAAGLTEFNRAYLPTTRATKLSGRIGGRGRGLSAVAAGRGPNCAVTTNTLCVLESRASVRAPFWVVTFSATLNLSGDSCFTMVSTPSPPQEAKASPVPSSNAVASTPSPIAGVARTLPLSASTTAIILLSQPTNRRRCLRSIESPLGSVQGARGHFALTSSLLGSIASSSLLSSMLTKISPLASLAANSGLPPSLIVPSTFPFVASIAVESWLRPLKVKTRLVAGS